MVCQRWDKIQQHKEQDEGNEDFGTNFFDEPSLCNLLCQKKVAHIIKLSLIR